MLRKAHVRCGAGENLKIISKSYLSLFIPTKKIPTSNDLNKLSSIQKEIYFTVLKRTMAMFETDYQYDETTVKTDVKGVPFTSKGRVILDKGWRRLEYDSSKKNEKDEQTELPLLTENEVVEAEMKTSEGFTSPPKAYTEGTLITAMKTCGKELENEAEKEILKATEGIGTEATRANVLETLKKQHYIDIQKNNVTVTSKGEILCQAVENTLLSSPEMTAKWETYLKKIKKEEGTQQAFLTNIQKFIHHTIDSSAQVMENSDWSNHISTSSSSSKKAVGICPACGKSIIDKGKFYGCEGYRSGCTFTLPKQFVGKSLSEATIKRVLSKKETSVLKGFKKKNGQLFPAALMLNEEHKLTFKPYEKTEK